MKKNIVLPMLLAAAVSVLAFYLALRNVPFSELWEYLGDINYWWVVPATAVILVTFLLRVVRWQAILSSNRKVDFKGAYHPLMIGFMINCIIPGRVGEVARPLILQRKEGIPFTSGLATVAAERLFDALFLITFLAVAVTFLPMDPGMDITFGGYHLREETLRALAGGAAKLSFVMIAFVILVSVEKTRGWIKGAAGRLPDLAFFASDELREKIERWISRPVQDIMDNVAGGFELVKRPRILVACIFLSAAIWSLQAFSYYLLTFGTPNVGLSYLEMFAVMVIICFFIALPSVPGYWGLWEAGGVFAMALFGIPAMEAAGFTLTNHVIQMLPVILAGLVSAVVTGAGLKRLAAAGEPTIEGDDPLPEEGTSVGAGVGQPEPASSDSRK